MCLRSSGLFVLSVLGPPGLVAAPVRYRANRVPRSWSGCHPVAPNPRITSHASGSPCTRVDPRLQLLGQRLGPTANLPPGPHKILTRDG
jgi:hypothetical protein